MPATTAIVAAAGPTAAGQHPPGQWITPELALFAPAPASLANATTAGTQSQQVIAPASGGYVVAWVSHDGSSARLLMQRYDAEGSRTGAETLVASGLPWAPDIAAAGRDDGGFVLAYLSGRDVYYPYVYELSLWLREFHGDGASLAGARQVDAVVNSYPFRSSYSVHNPAIAPMDDGGFTISWNWSFGDWMGNYSDETRLQRFDRLGLAVGPELVVSGSRELTPMADGGYLFAGVRYDGSGANLGVANVLPADLVCDAWDADSLGGGAYVRAWVASSDNHLYTQVVGTDGTALAAATLVSDAETIAAPAVAVLADGTYAVTWLSRGISDNDRHVFVQQFAPDGAPLGPPTAVEAAGPYAVDPGATPVIAPLAGGGLALAWTVTSTEGGVDVYTQRFEAARFGTDDADRLAGTAGGDVIYGLAGPDRIEGLDGDDRLDGGPDRDTMAGGPGDDIYFVDDAKDKLVERSGEGEDTVRSTVSWRLDKNVENLVLTGTAAIDGWGNAQDNVIIGNAAGNRLDGGQGSDTLDGGAGADVLVFSSRPANGEVDVLLNFVASEDVIELHATAFKALKGKGAWTAQAFAHGTQASDPGHRILHDAASGALLYDPDGSGPDAAVQFAVLVGLVGTLSADNFVVA